MDYLEINKKLWNNKTDVHYASDFYDVESFLKGKDTLNPIENALLGDIKGKKVLHLQCHFGLDTISLSRRGAQVTGVDFSDKAIARAKQLATKAGTDTRFIQCDVFSLKELLSESFDIVFTSYGTVGWLPDMNKWADTVSHFLRPNGTFVMAEFHPVVWIFSYDFERIEYNYMDTKPIIEEIEGTYTSRDAALKDASISWNHGLATVIDALIKAGLQLQDFKEYDYSPYNCFNNTVKNSEGKYQIKGLERKIPMVYSIKAVKQA